LIKIPKKQSYKGNKAFPNNPLRLKELINYLSLFVLYLPLPICLTLLWHIFSLRLLFIFYLSNIGIIFYLLSQNARKKYSISLRCQDLSEKINVLESENRQLAITQKSLIEKIGRYNSLKGIIEEINETLSLDSISTRLATIAFSLIGNNKGVCILYLIDEKTQRPSLFKSRKDNDKLTIKFKEGDVFDLWVLRHLTPLLIENAKEDFRFDLERIESQDARVISSLISAPFISENRLLGILRLDNPEPGFYSLDDLRLLATICDLGVVAIENAELFQKTQELAIHDALTSLYTKGYFLKRLSQECKRGIRQNALFSLLMIDIDYFKNYNDKFGHTAGDLVLKTLGVTMMDFFKKLSPVISRFGGEEFCVLLPGITKKDAYKIAEEFREKIASLKIILRQEQRGITVSIGVATFGIDAYDEDEIVMKADKAMYEAKRKGRDCVVTA